MENDRPITKSAWKAAVIGFAFGSSFALPALVLAVMSSGAGHGDYFAARLLYPVSILLTLVEGRIGVVSMAVGLLQFPAYGVLLGWAHVRGKHLPVAVVALVHLIAAMACFSGLVPDFS
jgi:hypothetical protein